jgi:serine/threonine protein kinase/ABC-type phosphate transport system substrate-binding protein
MDKAKNRQTTKSVFDSDLAGREFGKYRAERLISKHESRQTITLLAVDKETNQQVVLKAFGSFSEKSRKEFEKEIAAFKKLKNKHGVLIPLDAFEYENDYFIVTEYKNGGDLREWLGTNPKITETLSVFARIAESIDYIHENRIIHRDIKPENVVYEVLDERVTPYLMDFGISVTLSDTTSSFSTKHVFGTVEYMAPEFFSNVEAKKTKAVDIYAFGLMLYEALEGRHPFVGNTPQETIVQIISGAIPVPENTVKRLGESAGFMLTKALSKNPEDRPKTATEIIAQVGSQYIKYIGKAYGKYVIEEYLGRGPYGATYKAYELNNRNKKVALKLLAVSQAKKPEISGLKGLEHGKGVLPIIDAGYEHGVQYLVAEYLNGYNLRHILSSKGMEIQDVLKILKPLSKALDYLHEKSIVHGNLKPENILLRKNRADGSLQPFINDYGTLKVVEAPDAVNANSDVLLGSLDYLAPEILENKQPSPAADVYSLGVIAYEAMEGKMPFDAKSLPALIKQKLDDNVPVPGNLLEKGGVRAARVLLRAISVMPEQRQSSASDLVSQLEEAVRHRATAPKFPITQPLGPVFKPFVSFVKKYRWQIALLAVIALWAGSTLASQPRPSTVVLPATVVPATTVVPITTVASVETVTFTSPTVTPTQPPTFEPSGPCTLPTLPDDHDYLVPGHLLLQEVYKKRFGTTPNSNNDLYAIAYYNNRKILEGYNIYHAIDPVSLDVRRDWKIFIPPQAWIDEYKKFPAAIPRPIRIEPPVNLRISGSSTLSRLSAQISWCSARVTGIELTRSDSGNTASGLQDLCQGKADLFGAVREIDPGTSCVELEKFEVARYVMVIFINKNNPIADDIQKNPLTNEELIKLLTSAHSWKDVRGYWDHNEFIAKYYPSLESGEFEIVKNGIFPDLIVDGDEDDIPGLSATNNKQSLIDRVAGDANAVGIVDYDSYQGYENIDQLIAIPVNGVYASSAIANNDTRYPLMVTLYLYMGQNAYETNGDLRGLVNYYLSHELDFLDDLGYLYPSRKGYAGNRDTVP